MKVFTYFLFLFLPLFFLIAKENDTLSIYNPSSFDEFLERIQYQKNIQNKNIIGFVYGYSGFSYPHKDIKAKLSQVFLLEVKYGFIRKEPYYKKSSFIHYASESAFLGNYSSHMKLKAWETLGKTTDCWRFGFDFTNGLGYDFNNFGELLFYHSGNLSWYKIDFENPADSRQEQIQYDIYDDNFRFGTAFGSGIKYNLFYGLSTDIGYEHSIVFPKFMPYKWLLSSATELAIQRVIDYFGEEYILDHPKSFPVYNWFIKNAVSLIYYEFRRYQMNWPVNSEVPINYDSFRLSLTLTF